MSNGKKPGSSHGGTSPEPQQPTQSTGSGPERPAEPSPCEKCGADTGSPFVAKCDECEYWTQYDADQRGDVT